MRGSGDIQPISWASFIFSAEVLTTNHIVEVQSVTAAPVEWVHFKVCTWHFFMCIFSYQLASTIVKSILLISAYSLLSSGLRVVSVLF